MPQLLAKASRNPPRWLLAALIALPGMFPAVPTLAQERAADVSAALGQTPQPGWLDRQLRWIGEMLSRAPWSSGEQAGAPGAASGKSAQAPPVVTTSRPAQREIVEWDEYTGRLEPVEMVEIRARVAGYLHEVYFKDGQSVAAGDRLYSIDPRPYERVLATAQAELAQARTKVENAAREVERGRPLVEKRILSERVFDERENAMREAEAALAVTEARVKSAELELSFTRITAPIAGRIGRSSVTVGNYVAPGGSNNSTVLTTIVRQDPIHVYFDLGENSTLKYRRLQQAGQSTGAGFDGGSVQLALPDETGFPHKARLDFIDNRLDPGTGTLRARAVLDNSAGLFQPGMFARVRIAASPRHAALLIPDEAIGTDQSNKYVYVVGEDSRAIRKAVQLGPLVDGLRVVREGIEAGDWVVVRGIQRARPGDKVTAKREPLQISSAPPKPGQPVGQ